MAVLLSAENACWYWTAGDASGNFWVTDAGVELVELVAVVGAAAAIGAEVGIEVEALAVQVLTHTGMSVDSPALMQSHTGLQVVVASFDVVEVGWVGAAEVAW